MLGSTTTDFEQDEDDAVEMDVALSCRRKAGQGPENITGIGDWLHSSISEAGSFWLDSQNHSDSPARTVAMRLYGVSASEDGSQIGLVHGLVKTNYMTSLPVGYAPTDSFFTACATTHITANEVGLRLVGRVTDGPAAPASFELLLRLPPIMSQKLRRSSSSDARRGPIRPLCLLPRRASISALGKSYADVLRGRKEHTIDSPQVSPIYSKANQHAIEEVKVFEAEFPPPASPSPSPRRTRAGCSLHKGTKDGIPQLSGCFPTNNPVVFTYGGSMSRIEWDEAYFMKHGVRKGKVYKEASVAYQLL